MDSDINGNNSLVFDSVFIKFGTTLKIIIINSVVTNIIDLCDNSLVAMLKMKTN